ncbi:hypothetical protein DSL64_13125 [Dyadobacter luteus]|uniref:Secretion system C-terminal sorting domain-containing protein n=2 Tax=Dyadobacter luteus TaxID=2259619 RepID=A0A3D8YAN4_9BACT|nr:hypothetical protein DSL64_13125 [Dyadobacter luteus]
MNFYIMKLTIRLLLLLIVIPLVAKAQNTITVGYAFKSACLGNVHKIPVTLSGNFAPDNKFTIQIRETATSPILATLPATLQSENMEVTFRDSTLSLYSSVEFRIVASSPSTESTWSNTTIHTKGRIQLSPAISDTINLGEELPIKFITRSSTEVDVTLNDGSSFELTSYSPSDYISFHQIKAHTNEPFYIKTATNDCGAMLTSGQIKPVANPISIQTTSTNAASICEGSQVSISYSLVGRVLPENGKYRVRFRSVPNRFRPENPFVAEAPAELKNGRIITHFPENLKLNTQTSFQVMILADDQQIVGSPGTYIVTVYPKPAVDFYTPDPIINVGDETRVGVIFKGVPPFSAELSDGSVISASYTGEVYLNKQPDKTTAYTIKSFSTGCGITNLAAPKVMTVRVLDGIAMMREQNLQIYCAGSTSKIRIKASGSYGPNTSYTVHAYYGPSKQYNFPASRNGEYLEFVIPELPAGTDPSMSYDGLNGFYVSSNNPSHRSSQYGNYLIQSKPSMVPSEYNKYVYDEPQLVPLSFNIYGKWPFKIEDEKGNITTVQNDWWRPEIYLDKTKEFKIKSISNSCFKTENIPPTRITLTSDSAPGLYLEPLTPVVCYSDSIEVTFSAPGNFTQENFFHIQVAINCCNFTTLKTVRSGGTYKVKLPAGMEEYPHPVSFKVVSVNPFFTSETRQIKVNTPLKKFTVSREGSEKEPVLMLESSDPMLYFGASGGNVTSITYLEDLTEKSAQFENPDNLGFKITPPVGKTTKYTLQSITNSCGTQYGSVSTYVKVVPFKIQLPGFVTSRDIFCSGSQISIPFGIENGTLGSSSFSLQISKKDEINYQTIASVESSGIFNTKLPSDLSAGDYKMKVISSSGAESNVVNFYVVVLPGATISSPLPQPISTENNTSVDLKLDFTGSSPWTAVFEDNSSQTTNLNPDIRKALVKTGRNFELKTVYNMCGYGPVSGSVAVKVNAALNVSTYEQTACKGNNFVLNYELVGDVDLSDDYIRFELFDPATSKSILLDSTKIRQGKIELKIPVNLTGSHYQINCTVRNTKLSTLIYIALTRPVEVTLTGNTTINNGERTQLAVRSNSAIAETVSYVLSNGSTGSFVGGGSGFSYIEVRPAVTTTYTLSSVSNSCGAGKVSGVVTVEVNPESTKTIVVNGFSSNSMGLCTGDSLFVQFTARGAFTANNAMTIQLSDTTGKNFRSLVTNGTQSPLRALIPSDLSAGKHYRLRIVASDPGTASSAYAYPFVVSNKSSAHFASESALYNGIDNPLVIVLLEGGGPWRYGLSSGNSSIIQTRYSSNAVDSVYLTQASPGQTYTLVNVYNDCGAGTVKSPASITVSVLTAEPSPVRPMVTFGPNPSSDKVILKFASAASRKIKLSDLRGITLQTKQATGKDEEVDLRALSPGIYLINIEEKNASTVLKVIKQ